MATKTDKEVIDEKEPVGANQVSIESLSVNIKALRIERKQMSMAVFRQLKEEDIVDAKTASLKGIPWCTVNYFWGGCTPNHYHLVWIKGDEPRRSCIYHTEDSVPDEYLHTYRRSNVQKLLYCLMAYITMGSAVMGADFQRPNDNRREHHKFTLRLSDKYNYVFCPCHDCANNQFKELYYDTEDQDTIKEHIRVVSRKLETVLYWNHYHPKLDTRYLGLDTGDWYEEIPHDEDMYDEMKKGYMEINNKHYITNEESKEFKIACATERWRKENANEYLARLNIKLEQAATELSDVLSKAILQTDYDPLSGEPWATRTQECQESLEAIYADHESAVEHTANLLKCYQDLHTQTKELAQYFIAV